MIDWPVLISAHFWFSSQPGPMIKPFAQFLLIVFGICLAAAIVFYFVGRAKRGDRVTFKLLKKFQNLFTTLAIVGFIVLFFFQQQLPYLSSRYWLIIWAVIALVWIGFIGRFGFFEAPERRTELREREKLERYLPRKRKP